ncbi:Sensory transduction protein regX3 [bioreactor metagenome]|uniref:Sensory transduction protein regX3 n=1 Tax=bioreactor metagenome TaxID=1076179 RepID=A0A645BVK6_9ZZZZ
MKNILIVEDEVAISDLIAMNLNIAGYKYKQIYNGTEVILNFQEESYDLILLDVMIHGMDGFEVLEKIRNYKIPVIFLTAKSSLSDKLKGLKIGADDYITKPFETLELLARIEVVLRRYNPTNSIIVIDEVIIDDEQHVVTIDKERIDLTNKEYELLLFLAKNKNKAISREKLLEKIWGIDFIGETRTVDIHIQRLRKKLNNKVRIATVYKYGYRMEHNI